ncbi:MAG: nucleotidyltransferase family protein [Thermosynechococcaceae cyanobacterium]
MKEKSSRTSFRLKELKEKRPQILGIAQLYGASNLRVFGSVAREENDALSDIDLLVDLESGRTLLDLGGLSMDLQELLGCPVDVVTEKGLKPRLRERVLQEAIAL